MNKKLIRLTESDLHKIVKESVGKIINEIGDTPKGQRGLGGLHARKVLRNNDLSDDTYNYAQNARGGDKYDNRGNNENPLYHDYANGYIDYLNSHPDEYMANKRKRMSESYLHRIVKESVNRILNEDQEGYNQVMNTLNNPTAQKGLKKAWNKERKRNPNADYDTFEYNHALNLQNKKRKEDERYATVKESVNRIINEIGDTQRGQWMLGRLGKRQSDGGGKFNRGLSGINYASDRAYDANGGMYSKDYLEGYEDEGNNGRNADSTWDGNKYRRMQFNYDAKKMSDMDKLGRKFIDFIEHYQGGVLLQTIVDYESGNQTGKPESPLKELIPIFEEEVLGYDWGTKCTPEMSQAIKDAYNQWWGYAQDQLMPNEEY